MDNTVDNTVDNNQINKLNLEPRVVGTRKYFTIEQRIAWVQKLNQSGLSGKEFAKYHPMSKTAINSWKRDVLILKNKQLKILAQKEQAEKTRKGVKKTFYLDNQLDHKIRRLVGSCGEVSERMIFNQAIRAWLKTPIVTD